jgi:uncharacterized protein (TIGR02217 family)
MTTPPIFPALAGQGWSVRKKPTFVTTVASHVSAREVRSPNYANPVWQFELSFDGLDGTASGQYGGLGAESLQSLMGLFLQCQGQYGAFVFYDASDYLVSGQALGVGDGTTTNFQLARTLGGFAEPVVAPVTSATTLQFPSATAVAATAPVITDNGATVATGNYTISNPGGVVSFNTAPASGHALAWSGYFGFLCRFDGDDLDFEQFMASLWRAESVKFRSLRAQ